MSIPATSLVGLPSGPLSRRLQTRKHTAKCIYQIRCHARSVHQMAYRTRNQMSEFKRSPVKDTVKVQLATALLHAAAAEWGFGTLR